MPGSELLVVLGGALQSEFVSNAAFGFNAILKTWQRLPNMLKGRACHRAVFAEAESAIVVVGGSEQWPSTGFGECELLKLDGTQESGFKAASWQALPSLLNPRSCHGLAYFDGRVYACGGMMDPVAAMRRGPSTWTHEIDQFDLTNSCEVLNVQDELGNGVANSTWTPFPSLNFKRFGLQLLKIRLIDRTFLLAIGGRGPNPAAEYGAEAIEIVDGAPRTVSIETNSNTHAHGANEPSWTVLPTRLIAPRIDFAATVVENVNAGTVDVVILGGNRVTRSAETDSSRTWEVLRFGLTRDGSLVAQNIPGDTRLPASRVGCRAVVLEKLISGKQFLAVAGGFKAWGEGQNTYQGPLEQSVALLEIQSGHASRVGEWVGTAEGASRESTGFDALQKLPEKVSQPATCVAFFQNSNHEDL